MSKAEEAQKTRSSWLASLKERYEEAIKRRSTDNFYNEPEFIDELKRVQKYLLEKSGKGGFFNPVELLPLQTLYYIVFGERSNGKTFAILVIAAVRYKLYGEKFAYLRRWDMDLSPKTLNSLFGAFEKFDLFSFIFEGEYEFCYSYQRQLYLGRYPKDEEEENMANNKRNGIPVIREPEPFGYSFALTMMEHDKGGNYPADITTIIFDEFMSRNRYLVDELALFSNCISSIKRDDGRFRVWMLGNTVNKYCPYFREMGLKHINEMKIGEVQTYQGSDPSTTITVHWADSPLAGVKDAINKFFAFDNPKLKMITEGSFETADYPKCPRELLEQDIAFSFFLIFDNDTIRGDVYAYEEGEFIFWTPKTTKLQFPDEDLIYADKFDYRSNWRSSFNNPQTNAERAILNLIRSDKMFFADNQCGETLRNFMLNSKTIITR